MASMVKNKISQEKLAFARVALFAVDMLPAFSLLAISARNDGKFRENMIFLGLFCMFIYFCFSVVLLCYEGNSFILEVFLLLFEPPS